MSAHIHWATCSCGQVIHVYRGIARCIHKSQVREGGKWKTVTKPIRYRVTITEEPDGPEDGPVETETVTK